MSASCVAKGEKRCFPVRETILVVSSYILTVFECEMLKMEPRISWCIFNPGTRRQIDLFNRSVTRSIKWSFTQTGNWRDDRKFVNGVKLLLQVLRRAEQEVKDERWKSEPPLVLANRAWTPQRRVTPHHDRQTETCFRASAVQRLFWFTPALWLAPLSLCSHPHTAIGRRTV